MFTCFAGTKNMPWHLLPSPFLRLSFRFRLHSMCSTHYLIYHSHNICTHWSMACGRGWGLKKQRRKPAEGKNEKWQNDKWKIKSSRQRQVQALASTGGQLSFSPSGFFFGHAQAYHLITIESVASLRMKWKKMILQIKLISFWYEDQKE